MRMLSRSGAVVFLGTAIVFVGLSHRAAPQDPNLRPTFGSVTLNTGFLPDPFVKELIAGGTVQSNKGGVTAWVANPPDFRLYYTAGTFPLTISVNSEANTTLLINLPDGTWIANAPPRLRLEKPQSGRYDIWVGTPEQGKAPNATLKISERK